MAETYWSCAQTKPHAERLAVRNLRRQNFTVFFPFFLAPAGKRQALAVRPLFPNYVFIELEEEQQRWGPINSTWGITRLLTVVTGEDDLGKRRVPCRVPFAGDLRRLQIRGPDQENEPNIIPKGTMCRIVRGAFVERIGLVEMSAVDRVRLLLEVFNREISVYFHTDDIEVLAAPLVDRCQPASSINSST
jgi:transcription antitermination factor NusG